MKYESRGTLAGRAPGRKSALIRRDDPEPRAGDHLSAKTRKLTQLERIHTLWRLSIIRQASFERLRHMRPKANPMQLMPDSPATAEPAAAEIGPAPQAQVRVLVVEDESLVGAYIADVLNETGFQVIGIASTGREALTIARDVGADIALVDITLTGPLDGIEVACFIPAALRHRDDLPVGAPAILKSLRARIRPIPMASCASRSGRARCTTC
ncbi:MAG: response regulator [Aliidongia sp.]